MALALCAAILSPPTRETALVLAEGGKKQGASSAEWS